MTQNLANRLQQHNSGKSKFTSGHMPWVIIYTENHPSTEAARKREKYFHTIKIIIRGHGNNGDAALLAYTETLFEQQ